MGFQYTNRYGDLSEVKDWSPHDDWDRHYTNVTGFEDRDAELEGYLAQLDGRPRGFVTSAFNAGNSAASGGTTSFLGAGAFEARGGRRYRIAIAWGGTAQVGAGQHAVIIARDATQLVASTRGFAAGTVAGGTLFCQDVPAAGTYNYIFKGFTNATTVQLLEQYEILVEDIGAA